MKWTYGLVLPAALMANPVWADAPVADLNANTLTGTIELNPAPTTTHFGYEGEHGPEHWADLDPAWSLCATGHGQSPIDLNRTDVPANNLPDIVYNWHETPLVVLNNGHTLEFEYEPGSTVTFDSRVWELKQFHFHTPSEHTMEGGAHFPAELHAVHRDPSGNLLVVGLMIKEGAENPVFGDINRWKQLALVGPNMKAHLPASFNLASLLPSDRRVYRYAGSLTTPPCSEGVKWNVIRSVIQMSKEQLDALKLATGGNNARPTQGLFGRTPKLDANQSP